MSGSPKFINCIAVDDEPLALNLLCSYISQLPFLKLKGSYSNAIAALNTLQTEDIHIIFLDIRMPELSGIDLAKIIASSQTNHTRIIFTTAFDQYALESYKLGALDYLLKPFDFATFLRSVSRAQEYFDIYATHAASENTALTLKHTEPEYIFLKVEYQLVKVKLTDILYIEGLKDYVKVYLKDKPKPVLTLTSLKRLEEKLPPQHFMRIHRSYIVSLDHIDSITRNSLTIADCIIQVTKQYQEVFQTFLTSWTS